MPGTDDASWAAAFAHAGLTPAEAERVRVNVTEENWRVTVFDASFTVPPPKTQAEREDLAALVASALSAGAPPPPLPAPLARSDVTSTVPDAERENGPAPALAGLSLRIEAGARIWGGRDAVPSYALTMGSMRSAFRAEASLGVTLPANVQAAGAGRDQSTARLSVQVGAGTARAALLASLGLEASRFTDVGNHVATGALPDVGAALRAYPSPRAPFVLSANVHRTIGTTQVRVDGAPRVVLPPWHATLGLAYETRM